MARVRHTGRCFAALLALVLLPGCTSTGTRTSLRPDNFFRNLVLGTAQGVMNEQQGRPGIATLPGDDHGLPDNPALRNAAVPAEFQPSWSQ